MKSITKIPNASHLVGIQTVRELYASHSGNLTATRQTVTKWLCRKRIAVYGANPKQRVFDRAAVVAALESDFPNQPKFITVEDAFLMANLPYPNSRK